jgi:uncharacterized LabA/DUF88 family protein
VAFAFLAKEKMRTYVYVDGFNLYYAIKNSGAKWLDLKTLAEQVVPAASVEKVRYFTARVSSLSDPGAPARQQLYFKALESIPEVQIHYGTFLAKSKWCPVMLLPAADRLITDMAGAAATLTSGDASIGLNAALPKSHAETLTLGHYGTKDNKKAAALPDAMKAKVFTMEEKGSDVNLAVHLLNDAWAGRFDAAIVISNDTDLEEPIRMVAQERKLPVYLLTPSTNRGASEKLKNVATFQRHIRQSHLNGSQFPDPVIDVNGNSIAKPATW